MPGQRLIDSLRDPSEKTLGLLMLAPAMLLLALIVAYVGVVRYMAGKPVDISLPRAAGPQAVAA